MQKMENMIEIYFLNPSNKMNKKIHRFLETNGFRKNDHSDWENHVKYVKKDKFVYLKFTKDSSGPYVDIKCSGFETIDIHELLRRCPECNSRKIKAYIWPVWGNNNIDRLATEGRIGYGGAYDRIGTMPATKSCLKCGCKWHNLADWYIWSDAYGKGIELDENILGIE